jgi:hypothetical protein
VREVEMGVLPARTVQEEHGKCIGYVVRMDGRFVEIEGKRRTARPAQPHVDQGLLLFPRDLVG